MNYKKLIGARVIHKPTGEKFTISSFILNDEYEILCCGGQWRKLSECRRLKPKRDVKPLIEFIKMVEAAHPEDYLINSIEAKAKLAALAWNARELLKEWEK
jgi:hypothetical protein